MFKQQEMLRLSVYALFGLAAMTITTTPLFATEEDAAQLKKVEVTGSHIKRIDIEGPQPVFVIDRTAIERSGATTIAEVLRRMPSNSGPSFDEKFTNSFAPGSAGLSLRGLGQNTALVLINGRRTANYGFSQNITSSFVDLNSIPLGSIERIEVLKDGASAIYGSDAIAGVVNIIMRKDMEGSEALLSYGQTSEGDGETTRFSITSGVTNANSDLTFILDYFDRKPIWLRDRKFSATADHSCSDLRDPITGEYLQAECLPNHIRGDGYSFLSLANTTANVLDPVTGWVFPRVKFNYNPYITMVPETNRLGLTTLYNHELTTDINFFAEISASQNKTHQEAAPTPFWGDSEGVIIPATNVFNPYGVDVFTFWRMAEAGPRINDLESLSTRGLFGLEGTSGVWDWESGITVSRSSVNNHAKNYINRQALIEAINNGTINPFGNDPVTNTPDVMDGVKATTTRTAVSNLKAFDIGASREIHQLPAGGVGMAVGFEYREENIKDTPGKLVENGQIVGSGGTASKGERDLKSAYFEFEVPVLDQLKAQVAIRTESYSDFGSTTNPKIALRFQPNSIFMLRGSYGTGFRAPSLPEMHMGESTSFPFLVDTERCKITGADADCGGSQYRTVLSGNADLQPEESKNLYIGGVVEPLDGLTVGVDYWKFEHTDIIADNTQNLLDVEGLSGSVVERLPTELDGTPGQIIQIHDSFRNLAKQETDGIDIDVKYQHAWGEIGDMTYQFVGTFVHSFDRQALPDDGNPDTTADEMDSILGEYQYPKRRLSASVDWVGETMGASIDANYVSSYKQYYSNHTLPDESHPDGYYNKVDAFLTFDAQYRYTGFKNTALSFGVDNILDEDPPFSNSEKEGYDFATHDPGGRMFYGKIKYSF